MAIRREAISMIHFCEGDAKDIGPFYREKSGIDLIREAISDHGLTKIAGSKIDKRLLVMDFGEIASSWRLEKEMGILLLKLRWIESPFETSSGIDLIGIALQQWAISFVEVKTRTDNSDTTSSLCCSSTSLAEQLSRGRIDKRFHSQNAIQGSRIGLARIIKEKIVRGELPRDPSIIKTILGAIGYDRFGFIVHPSPNLSSDVFDKAIATLGSGVTFVDFAFQEMVNALASFEQDSTV